MPGSSLTNVVSSIQKKSIREKVVIFWDLENCQPPSGMPGYLVVNKLRSVLQHFGSISMIKAYLEISDTVQKKSRRSELQSSGVSLIDCPHNGKNDSVDKMMMVDMLSFAMDNLAPATIVLISGDRDFVYALSVLRNRWYTIVLIVPNMNTPVILKSQANVILEWNSNVLQFIPNPSNNNNWAPSTSNTDSARLLETKQLKLKSTPDYQEKQVNSIGGSIGSYTQKVFPATEVYTNSNIAQVVIPSVQTPVKPLGVGFFDNLFDILVQLKMEGISKPSRSTVGMRLIQKYPCIYQRAEASNFKKLTELAMQEGLIVLGGTDGNAWIALSE